MKYIYLILFAILLIFSCKLAPTDDNYINVPKDYSTIQEAIDSASKGDTILVEPGTYYENINFNGKEITVASKFIIDGNEEHILNTIIDGHNQESVVTFKNGETENTKLIGFTIQNGRADKGCHEGFDYGYGGGILCKDSSPWLSFLRIKDNKAFSGAGIAFFNSNSIVNNVIIENNICIGDCWEIVGEGGGIFDFNSNLIVNNSVINNNSAENGSAIYSNSYSFGLNHSKISSNVSGWAAIVAGSMVLNNVLILDNETPNIPSGAGISGGKILLTNCIIAFNEGFGIDVGGWYNPDGRNIYDITNSIFFKNTAGLRATGVNINIHNCIFKNNIEFYLAPGLNSQETLVESKIEINYSNILNIDWGIKNDWEPKSIVVFNENSISSDPFFVDPINTDFHLQFGSPCIDTGNPDAQYNDVDGSQNDMGAYGGPGGDW